ncbi:putative ejection protein [Pseudoalteromonas virus vB_PspP-H6/1]|nr:putative ejection protein [Pseudoalteromonas virus vB_PspP-H6/1]
MATQYGLSGYEAAANQGLNQAQGTISNAMQLLSGVGNEAIDLFNPYSRSGTQANQLQAAYSGALGADAQQQAYQNFQESPATQFLREQGTNQTVNAAAATGQNVGGNILKELSSYNQGLASQDLNNQINQLNTLSNQGMSAAGNQSNIMQSLAGQGANLMSQGAGYQYGTGQNTANARYNTGQQMSSNIGNTTSALSSLQNQQGLNLADILGGNASAVSNLISQTGSALSGNQTNLASILANLAVGQGSELAGLQSQIGASNAAGTTGQASAIGGLLTSGMQAAGMAMSDRRLKKNIVKVDELPNGLSWYKWEWNGLLDLAGEAYGVIADEVKAIMPKAVVRQDNGYDAVNYSEVLNV